MFGEGSGDYKSFYARTQHGINLVGLTVYRGSKFCAPRCWSTKPCLVEFQYMTASGPPTLFPLYHSEAYYRTS